MGSCAKPRGIGTCRPKKPLLCTGSQKMRETSYISNFYIVDIQVFEFSKCAKSSAFPETSYTTALEANFFTLRSNFQSTKRPCIIQIADHCKLLQDLFGSILSIKCRDSMDGTFEFPIPSINQGFFMDGTFNFVDEQAPVSKKASSTYGKKIPASLSKSAAPGLYE